jgi:hypothetical protein
MSKETRKWIKNKIKENKLNENFEIKTQAAPQANFGGGNNNNNNFTSNGPGEPDPGKSNMNPMYSKNTFMNLLKRLTIRFGETSSIKYSPLIRYVSKNPKMLDLLEDLIEKSSTMQSSLGKKIFNNKFKS